MEKYWNVGMSVLLGIGVFLFWWLAYPHALSYQEQYQLFLWTGDYFLERMSVAGGFTDWLAEFIVQFYYIEWLGALLLAVLFVALLQLLGKILRDIGRLTVFGKWIARIVPIVCVALLWWLMGDVNVLLSLPVAIVLALSLACIRLPKRLSWIDLLLLPVVYWLIGPMVWIYVLMRVIQWGWKHLWSAGWLVAVQLMAYAWLLPQWPLEMVLTGLNYYRIPLHYPQFSGYDKDTYELIRQDYLIRNERWDELIERAQTHVVQTTFWSNSVNLALSQKRQLAEHMFDYYQSGSDALVMPRMRDMTSNLPSAEALFRLGMINSAQRYMFDTQESILNYRKSGRCTKRIAECMIINGHYAPARKQLELLKHSLFYSRWAEDAEQCLNSDARVMQHPDWARLRQLRFKEDFLFSYPEIDKIFGMLFVNNPDNKMALDYFMAQQLLNGSIQGFMQHMSWVQQYGGYHAMPLGYQDAVRCIQSQGREGHQYGQYVQRQLKKGGSQ